MYGLCCAALVSGQALSLLGVAPTRMMIRSSFGSSHLISYVSQHFLLLSWLGVFSSFHPPPLNTLRQGKPPPVT